VLLPLLAVSGVVALVSHVDGGSGPGTAFPPPHGTGLVSVRATGNATAEPPAPPAATASARTSVRGRGRGTVLLDLRALTAAPVPVRDGERRALPGEGPEEVPEESDAPRGTTDPAPGGPSAVESASSVVRPSSEPPTTTPTTDPTTTTPPTTDPTTTDPPTTDPTTTRPPAADSSTGSPVTTTPQPTPAVTATAGRTGSAHVG
jgi:hypothetical protein